MMQEGFKRKHTATLCADVVGYSRLMEEDDIATVRALGQCRKIIADCIGRYRGRVVDSPGDDLLAEFNSTVDAIRCAVEIQRELENLKKAGLPVIEKKSKKENNCRTALKILSRIKT
jgi:adenylate cyclase